MPPPWSSRLLSPNARKDNQPSSHPIPSSSSNTGAPSIANGASPANSRSHVSEADILQHAYGSIPSLPQNPQAQHGASASKRAAPPRPLNHGRSMSHPFPSLFHGKHAKDKDKRRDGDGTTTTGGEAGLVVGGFEFTDEDRALVKGGGGGRGGVAAAANSAMGSGSKGKERLLPDKDLMEGTCMTCHSMVRWPRELKVFRCTVCLTINDLAPIRLEARRGDGQRVAVPGAAGPAYFSSSTRGSTLSIEKTKQLIDQCITTYLLERLKHQDAGHSSSEGSPAQSPLLQPMRSPSKYVDERPMYLSPSPVKPVHSPGRPIPPYNGLSDPNREPVREYGYPSSAPSSTSSPGPFIRNMEKKSRPAYHGQNRQELSRNSEEHPADPLEHERSNLVKGIFKPLEEYLIHSFGSYETINSSFSTIRPSLAPRAASEGSSKHVLLSPSLPSRPSRAENQLSEMDAKTLLIGDIAENGFWWTGEKPEGPKGPERSRTQRGENNRDAMDLVTLRSPRIEWHQLNEWYYLVTNAARGWRHKLDDLTMMEHTVSSQLKEEELDEIADHFADAQYRIQRVLLKATEALLKRPARPLTEPSDLRFLLIVLGNPLLYPSHHPPRPQDRSISVSRSREIKLPLRISSVNTNSRSLSISTPAAPEKTTANRGTSGQHSGIIKRILGLLSNVSNECHHHLVSWFARYSDSQFQRLADLIGSFVTYRLTRQHGKAREIEHDPTAGLVPNMGGRGESTSAHLHAALGTSNRSQSAKKTEAKRPLVVYSDDWQIKAAARVMALVFAANNSGLVKRGDRHGLITESVHSAGLVARDRAHRHGQILATSDFYNSLLDYSDLIADFEAWESKRGKFSFCQYPFFLSIWAKIQILEHDARRQMEVKAREAFFDSIMTRKNVNQYLILKVRRECLVEDSLKSVSEVVGTGSEEIKKGLRIEFKGEEGIDAGGLRKEWFLLLVRDVFNPEHGMFVYDDDSRFCYFNPNSFETTDQFFLVGVVLGLAIYNSTILDVAFPPFAFRKLLAAAPNTVPGASSHIKPTMTYTLEDLAEYKPVLANGLRQLLDFDGDVESTYCRDFVADVERFGEVTQVPLCPGGETRAVTNTNRREFVDLYIRYLLDTAVVRQFEPFKRGFFTVCGGNALSLFRAEEIELLIRGSEEPLDIASLRAVSKNENWGAPNPGDTEPVIRWFWETFQHADPRDQRKLLGFVTGSDRIPAMGTTNLVIKLSCLGDDSPRFPVARTCFNQLSLWRYSSREKLETKLWTAVHESEGFGLK